MDYTCPLCGNKDPKYFGYRNGKIYCRRCISFHGEMASETILSLNKNKFFKANISYTLSQEQEEISLKILEGFKRKKNTLVYAVCGAGKTELVFKVIEYALKKGGHVGFAIPRKDVVIELRERLAKTFDKNKVIALYGGHNNELTGDIIVLTTHQLYRYEHYFDLLILDEIDAFPYKDNPTLEALFKRSIKGNYVMMSATPSKRIIDEFNSPSHQILKLFHRYHKNPLPLPKVKIEFLIFKYIFLIKKLKEFIKEDKPVLVFAPTIKESESLFSLVRIFLKGGNVVHSKKEDRPEIISDFRERKYKFLITTSVLERGVTLSNLQVIIFHSDHYLYTSSALIQISGRVGRVKDFPKGEIIYIASKKTKEMEESIETINGYNKDL